MVRVSSTLIVLGAAGICLTGCQSARVQSRFDAKAAEYVLKGGTGRIDGQAFLKRDYGRLVTAAGERVFLLPATPYTMERFERMFGGERRAYFGTEIEDTPAEYYRYRRETKVDMTGKFSFEDLAPGHYIVATRVFWTEPKSYYTHGGAVYDLVEVKKDETTAAIISGK
jgi:hypothetical protein